jgi:hypothetical protein
MNDNRFRIGSSLRNVIVSIGLFFSLLVLRVIGALFVPLQA